MLPRWAAKAPYLLGLWVIRLFLSLGLGLKVWNRNSTKTNSFVFGVSDLDLTVLGRGRESPSFLAYALSRLKLVFLFLGEVNYYDEEDLSFVLNRINPYELQRDPELRYYILENKTPSKAQEFVFLARMLFSDVYSLRKNPELRQAKWQQHFRETGHLKEGDFITLEIVVEVLKKVSKESPRISQALDLWVGEVFKQDFNPYRASMGEGYWILAPHLHIWFEEDERSFFQNLNAFEKEVMKAQVEWEFWGLYTQRLYQKNNVLPHLERLLNVLSLISPNEASSLEREISLVFKHR